MSETNQIIFLFFALPGFITFAIIRYVALLSTKQSQIEIVFYSLVCSVLSYLIVTTFGDTDEIRLFWQFVVATALGLVAAYAIKLIFMRNTMRHSPWYNFWFANKGRYVIVYTKSGHRIYGWMQLGSDDLEPRREVVLGNPCRIKDKGKKIPLGETMLITEPEIARVLSLKIDPETDSTSEDKP